MAYTPQLKQRVTKRLLSGESAAKLSKELKISVKTLYNWKHQASRKSELTESRSESASSEPRVTEQRPQFVILDLRALVMVPLSSLSTQPAPL